MLSIFLRGGKSENLSIMFYVWLLVLLLLLPNSVASTSPEEIQALKSVGESLGIGADFWNYSQDPCNGTGWTGIRCSSNSTIIWVELRGRTGFLSDSICKLEYLYHLDISSNFLSGQLPRCIGTKLKLLEELWLASANLTGGFPEELGNLNLLTQLELSENKLTGPIPSSVGGMTSLEYFSVDHNQLEGELPAEFGKLTNLVDLYLQGNRLSGTLTPLASLRNLTNLSGFNNRFTGNLSILEKLLSLQYLDFHLNNFNGPVPGFNESFNLTLIDFSFNQLSASIPESLSKLPTLTYLLLGHNNLTGNLQYPNESFISLQMLDISHNSLTGPLPKFPSNLSVDFSFNSFSLGSASAQSGHYFNCQSADMNNRTALCGHQTDGRKLHSHFGVLAGSRGREITNKEGITFQKDANFEKTGFYYLDGDGSWSVEVSGMYSGTLEAQWHITIPPEYQDDSLELYQTARWSSSYMAYHGTNLEDGPYSVTLYFCETEFQNSTSRTFDVILQGKTIVPQLDVVKLAGTKTAYKITQNTTVINGRLSIEFINTGHMSLDYEPNNNYSGAMVSAISVKSFNYMVSSSSTWNWWKVVRGAASAVFVLLIISMFIIFWKTRSSKKKTFLKFGLKDFTYQELFNATDGFSSKNKLGEGGFGAVYMGRLDDQVVAVKQLLHQTQQARDSLKQEIEILSSIEHRNLAVIRGYCLDAKHQLLVFDYMERGSLEGFLHGDSGFLSWKQRHRIAVDTALGLAYLHEESRCKIIHCDLKPPNILLTSDLQPIISDFGMARHYEDGRSHVTATKMGGTIGYLAPEYAMHYQLSDKADVYSFGVVLLELISGRKPLDSSMEVDEVLLVAYAQRLAKESPIELAKLVDKRLESEIEVQDVVNAGTIAVLCTMENPSLRPKMRDVWLMLQGMLDIPAVPLFGDKKLSMTKVLLSAYKLPLPIDNVVGFSCGS